MKKLNNLLATEKLDRHDEVFEDLLRGHNFRAERIVSHGHITPPGTWYDQAVDEWVVLLQGAARLRFEQHHEPIALHPGDYLNIPAHQRHRVEWTDPQTPTVWLAIHYQAGESNSAGNAAGPSDQSPDDAIG